MVKVTVTLSQVLVVSWSVDRAFELIADVPRSASHFPGLQRLDDLGGGVYGWNLKPFELGSFHHAVRYKAHYRPDPVKHTVTWSTVPDPEGNTQADGRWEVTPSGQGARLSFQTTLVVDLPIPRMTGPLARRTVPPISQRQIRQYLTRIARTMDGRLVD